MAKEKKFEDLFPYEFLGVETKAVSGNQRLGDCPICGKEDHFYINAEDGQYECKVCQQRGNVYTFIRWWYSELTTEEQSKVLKRKLEDFAESRGIDADILRGFGLRYYTEKQSWIIPVRNLEGSIVNLRHYYVGPSTKKSGSKALVGMKLSLGGLETVRPNIKTIWLCEGEWDAMALMFRIIEADKTDTDCVLWLPGAGVFKESWIDVFKDRKINLCYDNDKGGFIGRKRVGSIMHDAGIREEDINVIDWEKVPNANDGHDIRDLHVAGFTYQNIVELLTEFPKEDFENREENINEILSKFPHISERKITWEQFVASVSEEYKMTPDLKRGLKMIVANLHSLNVKDTTPNWQHIVSPAGSMKTEMLSFFGGCRHVYIASSSTSKSLVSGFATKKGSDPSLIPKLIGKCFMIKDFTEIIEMGRGDQEEFMATLRGAYDGYIVKMFGNGVVRKYDNCQFNLVTGTTQIIYGDNKAAMGERFLKYVVVEGNEFDQIDEILEKAVNQTGRERTIRNEISALAQQFCEVRFDYTEIPQLSAEDSAMLSGLARAIAFLRTHSVKMPNTEILLYRPQIEYGTRPMKVLALNLRCLGMVNGVENGYEVTDEDRAIIVRNAVSSMTPFTAEIAQALYKAGDEGLTTKELAIASRLHNKVTTLNHFRSEMELTGFVESYDGEKEDPTKAGAPPKYYRLSPQARYIWKRSRISEFLENGTIEPSAVPKQKNRLKTGKIRINKKVEEKAK